MIDDKRLYPRVECKGDASVRMVPSASRCPATIVNLSEGGCLLVLKEPGCLSQDTTVELTFTINNHLFRIPGQVKAKRSDTAIGFQFRFLGDRLRRQLEALLEQLIEGRPARSSRRILKEQRRYPRLGCIGPAAVQIGPGEDPCPAVIVDLSAGGCLMELRGPQRLSQEMVVELTFDVNHLPFRVRGQVRAIRSDTRIGFQFHLLRERVRMQIEDLMKELTEDIMKRRASRTRIGPGSNESKSMKSSPAIPHPRLARFTRISLYLRSLVRLVRS
jgi:c-di-GMP-binding flagellar brake protein YcgR